MEKKFEYLESLRVHMSDTDIVEELVRALSTFQAVEQDGEGILGYIHRMNEIPKPDKREEFSGTIGCL